MLVRLSFTLIPLSVLFIKYYPAIGRGYLNFVWTPVYTGVALDKNALGLTCMLCGVATVWRLCHTLSGMPQRARRRTFFAHAAVLLMVLWLMTMANSVTSWSCFTLGSSLLVLLRFRSVIRRRWLVHTLVAAMLSLALSALFLDAGAGLVGAMGRDPTLTGRTEVWTLVLKLAGNPLFGTGFESFWLGERLEKIWSAYWWHPNEAHNGYLEAYLNLGWIGIALLATAIVSGYRNIQLTLRSDRLMGTLRLAYFTVGLTYNLTESAVRMLHPVWTFLLFALTAGPLIRVPRHPHAARTAGARTVADSSGHIQPVSSSGILEEVNS